MYDLLIQGGVILDGSGAPSYRADVAVKDGRIEAVGRLEGAQAVKTIQAQQLAVAPGFIDIHSHDDLYVLENKRMDAKIRQGVTTTVTGNCGFGLYPVLERNKSLFYEYASGLFGQTENQEMGFESLLEFNKRLKENGAALNVASLTAHGVLRVSVMGFDNRKPTASEMEEMKDLLRRSMKNGSVGMSFGLLYPPGAYADTDELIELSRVVSEEGGIITCHIRSEARYLLESIEEMIEVARQAQVPLEISHLKACGFPNFGKGREALKIIASARQEGIDVTFDQYPYPAGSTTATTLLPPWSLEGGIEQMLKRLGQEESRQRVRHDLLEGVQDSVWEPMWKLIGWDNIMICAVESEANKKAEGRFISELASETGAAEPDVLLQLIEEEEGQVMLIMFQQDLNELEDIMADHAQMFGTDGLPVKDKKAHPRLYGTYPRVLGTYVREKKLLSLERAVNKMTYLPANRLGLLDRGLLRPGMAADITIFDPQKVADLSTYENPAVSPEGIHAVIVNGTVVLEEGEFTGQFPGEPLARSHSVAAE